jgi:hypothetical protein
MARVLVLPPDRRNGVKRHETKLEVDYFALSSDISPYVNALNDDGGSGDVSSPVCTEHNTAFATDDTDYFELSSDISPYIEGLKENDAAAAPAPFKVHLLFFFKVNQI